MLRSFKTNSELTDLRRLTANELDLLDVNFAIKVCNEMGYPDASVEAYANCTKGEASSMKSLIMILWHKYTRAYITFKLVNNGTLTDLEWLLDQIGSILEKCDDFILHATKIDISEHVCKYLSQKFDVSSEAVKSITLYLSDEAQVDIKKRVILLPDGFEFGELDAEKDALFVNEMWTIANAPDVRNTSSKIAHLPNTAVRRKKDGKLVSFIMMFSFGAMNHVYTLPEFRHTGIAMAIQDRMYQKLVAIGVRPFGYSVRLMEEAVARGAAKTEENMQWARGMKILTERGSDKPVLYENRRIIRRKNNMPSRL